MKDTSKPVMSKVKLATARRQIKAINKRVDKAEKFIKDASSKGTISRRDAFRLLGRLDAQGEALTDALIGLQDTDYTREPRFEAPDPAKINLRRKRLTETIAESRAVIASACKID